MKRKEIAKLFQYYFWDFFLLQIMQAENVKWGAYGVTKPTTLIAFARGV